METNRKGVCINVGNCKNADSKMTIEVSIAADFICPAGTTLNIAPLGQRGCCQDIASGGAGMDIPSSCSGPEVWMSVQATDATTCEGYDLKLHF